MKKNITDIIFSALIGGIYLGLAAACSFEVAICMALGIITVELWGKQ